ncbi:MAG: hypothetical protein E2579_15830 [Pseudomonas sp.]|nr:hypothetical protein [Pseudomonas sp.]
MALGTIHWRVVGSDGFRPLRASHLIRCAHPSGQPAAVTSLHFVALACPRESNQREGHPDIRARRPRPAAPGFPRSITAPGARREGPSLAHHGSRDIHVAQPLPR